MMVLFGVRDAQHCCAPQVGPRKKALDLLAAAFLRGGRAAVFDVFAGLPHNETGFATFDADRAAARMGLAPAGPRAANRRMSGSRRTKI